MSGSLKKDDAGETGRLNTLRFRAQTRLDLLYASS
jgi:hypothetical protein